MSGRLFARVGYALGPTDNGLKCFAQWRRHYRLLKQPEEKHASVRRGTPIEAKSELLEIPIQHSMSEFPLVSSHHPALEQRGYTMNSRQKGYRFSRVITGYSRPIIVAGHQSHVGTQPVRYHDTSRINGVPDESKKTLAGSVWYSLQPDSANTPAANFGSNDNEGFLHLSTTATAFLVSTDQSLINFDLSRQQLTPRANHGLPEPVQTTPGRSIATKTQSSLKSERAHPTLLIGHPPSSPKPQTKWYMAPLENSTGRHRSFHSAIPAEQKPPACPPSSLMPAMGTAKSIGPTESDQVVPTGFFGTEPVFKFEESSGEFLSHQAILTIQVGPSAYPTRAKSSTRLALWV
jgi:hypothetical protein